MQRLWPTLTIKPFTLHIDGRTICISKRYYTVARRYGLLSSNGKKNKLGLMQKLQPLELKLLENSNKKYNVNDGLVEKVTSHGKMK